MENSRGILTQFLYILKGIEHKELKQFDLRDFFEWRIEHLKTKSSKINELNSLRELAQEFVQLWSTQNIKLIQDLNKSSKDNEKLYSISQLKEILGCSHTVIHNFIKDGLPYSGSNKKFLIRESDFEDYIQKNEKMFRVWKFKKELG